MYRRNIVISKDLISEQKEEVRALLEDLKSGKIPPDEARKIRKKLRRRGFRLSEFVGAATRETPSETRERKHKRFERRVSKLAEEVEEEETPRERRGIPKEIRSRLSAPWAGRFEKAETLAGAPRRIHDEGRMLRYAIMLAQHKYDTPSKIADVLVDAFYGLPRSEATRIAKRGLEEVQETHEVAGRRVRRHEIIDHAGMIGENPKLRETRFAAKQLAIAMINWARRKYEDDAEYMIFHTKEAREGFIGEHHPMSDHFEDMIFEEARKLVKHTGIRNNPAVIYDKIIAIEAQKGDNSNFPGEKFRHDFKGASEAKVIGLEDGSLLVKSTKGKRLWDEFEYPDD